MSETQEEKLEKMLRSRRIETASADLAQRIILMARQTPQHQPATLGEWLRGVFAEFHLPRPAYVFAASLLVGFIMGLNMPTETPPHDATAVSIPDFLDADEAMLL